MGTSIDGQKQLKGTGMQVTVRLCFVINLIIAVISPYAQASEPAYAWSGGSIHFATDKGLSIETKQLFISPSAVRVKYIIRNTLSTSLSSMVSFHVPSHPRKNLGSQILWDQEVVAAQQFHHDRSSSWTLEQPDNNKTPFINFKVLVNDKEIQVKNVVEAIKGQTNITQLLQDKDLPLSPDVATCSNLPLINFDKSECVARLEELRHLGLIDESNQALWKKQIRFEWEQKFLPNSDTIVEYTYRPATGFTSIHFDDERPPLESLSIGLLSAGCFLTNACFSEKLGLETDLVGWILKKFGQDLQTPDKGRGTYLYEVDYLLKSDEQVGHVIKNFELTLEHPEGGTIQVCPLWADMFFTRVSPTTVKTTRTNFTPRKDLAVFFASPTIIKEVF